MRGVPRETTSFVGRSADLAELGGIVARGCVRPVSAEVFSQPDHLTDIVWFAPGDGADLIWDTYNLDIGANE